MKGKFFLLSGIFKDRIFSNSLWMILEKVISIFGLLFVTSYVAKYIGPENFGKLSFVTSLFIIVQALAALGTEHVLLKRLARKKNSGIALMNATSLLRHVIYTLISLAVLIYLYRNTDEVTLVFGVATAVAYYFLAIDTYAIYNNATLNSRVNTFCNLIGLSLGLILRYIIAYNEINFLYLGLPIVIVTLVPYFIKKIYFIRSNRANRSITFKNKLRYNYYLTRTGIPLALSTVSAIFYTRITLFLVMYFCGAASLGLFSVASQLASSWMFVTSALITSYYSKVYSLNIQKSTSSHTYTDAKDMVSKLNGIIMITASVIIILIILSGKYVINVLYGSAYDSAYYIMVVLCLNSFFSCMGPVASKYIILYSGYSYLTLKTFFTFLTSIPIAWYLTQHYGVMGAAVSTVIVEILSLTIYNYLFKNGLVFKMHLSTLNINKYISGNN
ncbi:oligosaccharide flippase family protein [Siccibacter turicensis]|uniref:oligosaccharide flippase family protein n=1 Tax=Siccibacter turicensis TaxID=357233 RepID=UPI002A69B44A|nr:oligosaccharide flippase family protein [Siccibacter turicensis]MDY0973031.1 oligosaccharide flippase family protein [Siccibacter turicensis]